MITKLIKGKSIFNYAFISNHLTNFQVYMLGNINYTDTQIFRFACRNMQTILENLHSRVNSLEEYLHYHNIRITFDNSGEITMFIPSEISDDRAEIMERFILESHYSIKRVYDSLYDAHGIAVTANSDAITITGNRAYDPEYLMARGSEIYNEYRENLEEE